MNIIVLGPPGSGKGTQGKLLSQRLSAPKIATGDLLRDAAKRGTDLGQQAKSYMDQGLLVPDEVIINLIDEVLCSPEASNGVIMDGFPRTVAQAEAVDRLLAERSSRVDCVLCIDVPEEEVVKRMLGRAAQEGRSDDTRETIQQRLAVFWEQTAPLVTYYRDRGVLIDIPGTGTVDAIAERIGAALRL